MLVVLVSSRFAADAPSPLFSRPVPATNVPPQRQHVAFRWQICMRVYTCQVTLFVGRNADQAHGCVHCPDDKHEMLKATHTLTHLNRSTPLVLAVQQGHTEAARVLIEAGAAIDVVPRAEDGSERAPSLARLAVDMRRGDLVSLLAKALIDRDSSETWSAEWAASSADDAAAGGGADGEGAAGVGKRSDVTVGEQRL